MAVDELPMIRPKAHKPRPRGGGDEPAAAQAAPRTFREADPGPVKVDQAYRRGRYRASQLTMQLTRYVKIRGDLAVRWPGADPEDDARLLQSAQVCADHLRAAKAQLQSTNPSLPVVANLLGLAERMLVPLYSPSFLRLRLHTIEGELRGLEPVPLHDVAAVQHAVDDLQQAAARGVDSDVEVAQTVLKDAITRLHGREEEQLLEDDLQVSRLKSVLAMVLVSWFAFLLAVPLVTAPQLTADGLVVWPLFELRGQAESLLLGAAGLSVVGAVGGVVSGMLSVRDSRATIQVYRTSMLKFLLRPAVGAVAALVLYLFLGAQVVSGIEVTSTGVFVVAAFLAGFSERYFLQVVSTDLRAPEPPVREAGRP